MISDSQCDTDTIIHDTYVHMYMFVSRGRRESTPAVVGEKPLAKVTDEKTRKTYVRIHSVIKQKQTRASPDSTFAACEQN